MVLNNVLKTAKTISIVFDLKESQILKQLALFLRIQTTLFVVFSITEICLFKYWLKFVLKRLVKMNDSMIILILTLENLSMSILFSLVRIHISDHQFMPGMKSEKSGL